jgi:hypothetical protein
MLSDSFSLIAQVVPVAFYFFLFPQEHTLEKAKIQTTPSLFGALIHKKPPPQLPIQIKGNQQIKDKFRLTQYIEKPAKQIKTHTNEVKNILAKGILRSKC